MATFNRIDKLRFVKVFRPHVGEQDAEEFADALQDEFSPLATKSDLRTELDRLREQMQRDQQTMLIKATAIWAGLLAAAVAIAQLF